MSSIFASRVPKTIEIPFDPPNTVTIKRLSGKHLAKAALENQLNSIDTFRRMGGAKFQKELNEIRTEPKDDAAKDATATAAPDPLAGYDKYALMTRGIVAWTYPESLKPELVNDDESELFAESVEKFAALVDKKGVLTDVTRALSEALKQSRMAIKAIEDLTDEAVDFFATEILTLSKPSLFVTEDEAKAAQGNEPSASIGS
jgi:hypothetical protein